MLAISIVTISPGTAMISILSLQRRVMLLCCSSIESSIVVVGIIGCCVPPPHTLRMHGCRVHVCVRLVAIWLLMTPTTVILRIVLRSVSVWVVIIPSSSMPLWRVIGCGIHLWCCGRYSRAPSDGAAGVVDVATTRRGGVSILEVVWIVIRGCRRSTSIGTSLVRVQDLSLMNVMSIVFVVYMWWLL